MDRVKQAIKNFELLNCNQAVFSVFAEQFGLKVSTATSIGAAFGGGMAQGKTCGVVTGAYMVIGLWSEGKTNNPQEQKAIAKEKLKLFNLKFIASHNDLSCKSLLGYDLSDDEQREQAKEVGVFQSQCPKYVAESVRILEEILD